MCWSRCCRRRMQRGAPGTLPGIAAARCLTIGEASVNARCATHPKTFGSVPPSLPLAPHSQLRLVRDARDEALHLFLPGPGGYPAVQVGLRRINSSSSSRSRIDHGGRRVVAALRDGLTRHGERRSHEYGRHGAAAVARRCVRVHPGTAEWRTAMADALRSETPRRAPCPCARRQARGISAATSANLAHCCAAVAQSRAWRPLWLALPQAPVAFVLAPLVSGTLLAARVPMHAAVSSTS
jgi:hypothetical protein